MGTVDLTSLMLVVVVAFFVPVLLHRARLPIPEIAAEILVGMVIGKTGFNLVQAGDPWLELLSLLGLIFLMFLSGVEIDFSMITRSRNKAGQVNPLLAGTYVFLLIMFFSFMLAWGLDATLAVMPDPFFTAILIATISLGVVLPTLKEKGIEQTVMGQTILLIAVLSDFVTMILLAVYVSLRLQESGGGLFLLLFLFLAAFLLYRIAKMFVHFRIFDGLEKATSQIGVRGSFALILFFVALAEALGAEGILGAFLAGVIISLVAPDRELAYTLNSFGYGFFIPIFFVMVGVNLDFRGLLQDSALLALVPVLLIVLYMSKVIPTLFLLRWFPKRMVYAGGLLLSSTLSLMIAAGQIGIEIGVISSSMNAVLVLVAVVTAILSPFFFQRLYPSSEIETSIVHILGANTTTLWLASELMHAHHIQLKIFTTEGASEPYYPLVRISQKEIDDLESAGFFQADTVVCGSADGHWNLKVAEAVKERGTEQVICILEDPKLQKRAEALGITVYSSVMASQILLKGMILYPRIVNWISDQDEETELAEVKMLNPQLSGRRLRELDFLGDALVLRLYRNQESILPHGNTSLMMGDVLLVSGRKEALKALRSQFS